MAGAEEQPQAMTFLQFPEKPPVIPEADWKRYQQLAHDLEYVEATASDLRSRYESARRQLSRRLSGPSAACDPAELLAAVPATPLVQ